MNKVEVTIREKEGSSRWIRMSMEEYIQFIKEQSNLLNIEKESKTLARKQTKFHQDPRHPGEWAEGIKNPNNPEHIAINLRDNDLAAEELARRLSERLNLSVTARKPNLPPKKNNSRSDK